MVCDSFSVLAVIEPEPVSLENLHRLQCVRRKHLETFGRAMLGVVMAS